MIGSNKTFLLYMQLDLLSHLKLMWCPMLIMTFFVLSIGFIHDIMNLLVDVLNVFNKLDGLINFVLNMSKFYLCSCKMHCNINGTQWLKSQTHLKGVVAS